MLNSDTVKQAAAEEGFDACGIAPADALDDAEFPLRSWLSQGRHAGLAYMERNADKRMDPRLLVEGARSVICVAVGYNPSRLMHGRHRIARYAYGDDYHERLKGMLFRLRQRLGIEGKICVDTVPISDKRWAAHAGLGWIGRHTLLVTPEWGTWVNLGEIVTPEECDRYDRPVDPPCHDCHRCVAACPNGALASEGPPMIDLRRCTAYHTIESRTPTLPGDLDQRNYAFGCDLCQLACPYNAPSRVKTRPVDPDRIATLERLDQATEEEYLAAVAHTPMSRIGYQQWRRNLPDAPSPDADA